MATYENRRSARENILVEISIAQSSFRATALVMQKMSARKPLP